MSAQPRQAAQAAPAPEPIVIGDFALNSKDTIRAALDEFNGARIVNFRKWFCDKDGSDKPTRKGIAFAVRHLPAFAALVNDALARARADGLLPDDGSRQ